MDKDKIDVGKTLRFGTFRRDLILLAVFVVVAPIAFAFRHWLVLAICAGFGLFQVYKLVGAQAALTLSPKGIAYAYDGIRFSIPWREIHAIALLDVPYKDVTAMTISRRFYDAHIHSPYGKLLNPNRQDYFEIGEDTVRVALYAAFIAVDAKDVFAMVEARWKAFGGVEAATVARASTS